MNETSSILDENRDMDTLGGRIGRAREACGLGMGEIARQLGVTRETWDNWEADREEPRANRLAMMAGFLNVSPSWLLYGVGESPSDAGYSEIIADLQADLAKIEAAQQKTAEAIRTMKDTLGRLSTQQAAQNEQDHADDA